MIDREVLARGPWSNGKPYKAPDRPVLFKYQGSYYVAREDQDQEPDSVLGFRDGQCFENHEVRAAWNEFMRQVSLDLNGEKQLP